MTKSEKETLIATIQSGVPNTAATVRTVLSALADAAVSYQVIELDVPTAFIATNFDPTGLGTGDWLGWAICNGNNGTRNRGGRVSMQYNATYPTLGATGGSPDAVVVSHSHLANGFGAPSSGSTGLADNFYDYGQISPTSTVGESGVGKNMQPYIVSLFVMKLPE